LQENIREKTGLPARLEFNSERDTAYAHSDRRMDRVLHLFHQDWHGIRSASACLPGHKAAISHEGVFDGEFLRHIFGLIYKHRIAAICCQGISQNSVLLAELIRTEFGDNLTIVAVTHVSSAQFEYSFEIEMQRLLIGALRRGIFNRIASVKPEFHTVADCYWPETIYNCAPNVAGFAAAASPDLRAVFIPVENTWRKNLYTNVLAACHSDRVDSVFCVNRPSALEEIADLRKLSVTGYLRLMNLYAFMGTVGCVLNASLAECQPMTQLESAAMGTPCITGPLRLPKFAQHPLTALTEVEYLDSPAEIRGALETILQERETDPDGLQAMITDYLDTRRCAALESYVRLLDV
jgi:hypothetical protein